MKTSRVLPKPKFGHPSFFLCGYKKNIANQSPIHRDTDEQKNRIAATIVIVDPTTLHRTWILKSRMQEIPGFPVNVSCLFMYLETRKSIRTAAPFPDQYLSHSTYSF
ncbi:hypothetical protein TNCV_3030931 [Trichonephila clavipes]|nr:hypothetical protein TNCV_3030931 [Trichonephila clavipes]